MYGVQAVSSIATLTMVLAPCFTADLADTGRYKLRLPEGTKPGDYRVRFTASSHCDIIRDYTHHLVKELVVRLRDQEEELSQPLPAQVSHPTVQQAGILSALRAVLRDDTYWCWGDREVTIQGISGTAAVRVSDTPLCSDHAADPTTCQRFHHADLELAGCQGSDGAEYMRDAGFARMVG